MSSSFIPVAALPNDPEGDFPADGITSDAYVGDPHIRVVTWLHVEVANKIRMTVFMRRMCTDCEDEVEGSSQLFRFTRVINRDYSQEDRVELMEMLWQVAYVDGELHDYEANLMRRIAGLIHVTDRDSGAARKRALGLLGQED